MEEQKMNNVTIIGLGSMGATLAGLLLKKGYQVTVWNRSIAKAEPLIKDGAIFATSVATAISASEVSIICVSDYEASTHILNTQEVKQALSGRVLIQLSTGSPQQARDHELWAQENQVNYLDGAIAASPLQMGNSEATIFTSGSLKAYQQSEHILKCLAGNVPYLGEQVSAASSTDLAFLSYLFGSYLGFFHAARILESDGLRVDDFGALIAQVSQVVGEVIKYESQVIQTETYDNPQSSINMCMTTVELFMVQAQEANINNEFPVFAQQLFKRVLEAGFGNEELGALIKVLR
ncbi:NAD(P)-dependent oxidoreductase [Lysinibacillus sp. ZYM-1]|uniref:NAD(P)-dependent oxidoreductase n=1 Tax=Lysinibacillus sp. ZYM-1 TaxID=1681184 RepID=UPI0009E7BC2D|nr:NAD(P)-binding domain-containing protein [Lysinibacillus sp. ZYM-1]